MGNEHQDRDQDQASHDDNEAPAVYSVGQVDGELALSRRSFMEIAAAAGGVAAAAGGTSGCAMLSGLGGRGPTMAHKEAVTALAVSPSGKLLASGDKEGTIKLWQLPEGALLQSWSAHSSSISGLSLLATDEMLWSVDSSGTLKRWRLPEGTEFFDGRTLRGSHREGVFAVPGVSNWYAVRTRDRGFELRSQETGAALPSSAAFHCDLKAMASTPDGRLLLVGGADGRVGVWGQGSDTEVQWAETNGSAVSAVTIDPAGTLALSAHADGRLRCWQVQELKRTATLKLRSGKPFSVAIRPQLDVCALGSEKPEIRLWDPGSKTGSTRLLSGHAAAVRSVVITPDGSLLISAGDDKTIRVWSLPDGKHLQNLVDLKVNYEYVKGSGYQGKDVYGRTVTFTLPCGSAIPPGAVCTCNCVPGAIPIPRNHTQRFNNSGYCTCDLICTCNTVCTCQSVGRSYYVSYWHPN